MFWLRFIFVSSCIALHNTWNKSEKCDHLSSSCERQCKARSVSFDWINRLFFKAAQNIFIQSFRLVANYLYFIWLCLSKRRWTYFCNWRYINCLLTYLLSYLLVRFTQKTNYLGEEQSWNVASMIVFELVCKRFSKPRDSTWISL
jgi:hypothetical protein